LFALYAHTQGLGSLLAKYLAQQGAKVIISARSEDKLQVQMPLAVATE
jgi:short-subunit dehydrogenase